MYSLKCRPCRFGFIKTVFRTFSEKNRATTNVKTQNATKNYTNDESINVIQKQLGQPTPLTHPHLLESDEVTPLIKKKEYQLRREALVELIMAYVMNKGNRSTKENMIIIPSASKTYMSEKIPYFFRQNSDFLYLTGCMEPDTCLMITTTDSRPTPKVTLFTREKDEHSELWDGPRTTGEDAVNFFGVDQALPITEMQSFISFFLRANKNSYIWYDLLNPIQGYIQKILELVLKDNSNLLWEAPRGFVHKLRIKKSPAEMKLMMKTCEIASDAISATMAMTKPGISEHQIYAKVDYESRMRGANYLAYPPVVAAGERANIIHYINNNQVVKDGEMVLMDAGCEYFGYTSDITRTWPANGKFSKQQKELYEVVLSVQLDLIQMCEGLPTLDSLFDTMCLLLGKRLQQLGVISKWTTGEALLHQAYQFCPHHVSHYLGIDVHDTPTISRNINIQPGMVFTIEPGVYISHKNTGVPEEFRGLGIRIEDDVLMTEKGAVVLTHKCPKTIEDVEKVASKTLL